MVEYHIGGGMKRYRQDEEPQDPFDLPEGEHQTMTFGGLTLYRNDYDGPMVVVVDHGGGIQKDGAYRGWNVHASELEALLRKHADELVPLHS